MNQPTPDVAPFRHYVQMVLPAVYGDELSYYEVLAMRTCSAWRLGSSSSYASVWETTGISRRISQRPGSSCNSTPAWTRAIRGRTGT